MRFYGFKGCRCLGGSFGLVESLGFGVVGGLCGVRDLCLKWGLIVFFFLLKKKLSLFFLVVIGS